FRTLLTSHCAAPCVRAWDAACLTSNIHHRLIGRPRRAATGRAPAEANAMPEAYYSTVAATERSALTSRRIPGARTDIRRVPIDLAAFEALYESHGARMKSLALNVLGNRSDAEDAVQETFLRAYKNRHSLRRAAALWR